MDQYNSQLGKLASSCGRYDPVKGWCLKPNIHNMPVYSNKVLNSNSKGIRGSIEYGYAKNPGLTRILVLGDSFTFGEEVSDNETYPFYLQQLMPGTEVINFGISGYAHDQMLLYLQEEGIKYQPDIVILGFLSVDMSRNLLNFRDYAKPKFKSVDGRLVLTNSPAPSPEQLAKDEFFKSKFLDVLCMLYCKSMKSTKHYHEMKNSLTEDILAETSKTIKNIGATPVFVLLDLERKTDTTPETLSDENKFVGFCEHSGVVHRILLRSNFADALKQDIAIKTTRHFNAEENMVVARGIADYLKANRLGKQPGYVQQ